jgi:glycosyltransferase involved in cell wall biosynthesis
VSAGLEAADLVVAPTAALLDEIRREYDFRKPARVIPNGSAAVAASETPEQKDDLVFAAGRLWDEAKNVSTLCAAASAVPWPVYLAGDVQGPAGSCAHSGAARFLGQLDRETMSAWYRRAAIYALPARYEPFGLSIVEAAAAGCALVLGDITTLRENWSGAALFVAPDNHKAVSHAINELIANPPLRARCAAAAAARANTFTVDAMVDGYLSAYAGLLESAAAA